jgi:ATP-dependent Clp protease ATP-binding subunit ClpC
MTSNIGSRSLDRNRQLGFQGEPDLELGRRERSDVVRKELKRLLSPEFINRVDEIVVFDSLATEDLESISHLMLARLNRQLVERKVAIEAAEAVHSWLVATACRDRSYGARPLRRALQRHVEDPLSEAIIRAGGVGDDGVVAHVSVEADQLRFSVVRKADEVGAPV